MLPRKVESDERAKSDPKAVPAGKVEGKYATPEFVSVEEDFAGEEPELFARDIHDTLVEKDTTGWPEHQVKIDQFQAFTRDFYGRKISSSESAGSVCSRASREET